MNEKILQLARRQEEWLKGQEKDGIVISSRIRIARNLAGFNFITKCTEKDMEDILDITRTALNKSFIRTKYIYLRMDELNNIEKTLLTERHLISKEHAEAEGPRGVAIAAEENISIMINEEDHLRMQILSSGYELSQLWERLNQLDNELESSLEYAFDDRYGYLTACPTNVGTGIRVSVMLHLPALKITNEIEKVLRAAQELKLAVRGLYGEGTEALGDYYQISNQTTLGKTEEEIIEEFTDIIIPQIIGYEKRARTILLEEHKRFETEDKIWRAYGILTYARSIGTEEALHLLSLVRLGTYMGIIKDINIETINELSLTIQPAHIQVLYGKKLDGEQRSIIRATYIREKLKDPHFCPFKDN